MPNSFEIINIVFDFYHIPVEIRDSKSRKRELVNSRQVAMFYLKENTNETLNKIGNYFNRDHATVLHAIKTVNNLSDTDKKFRHELITVKEKIKYGLSSDDFRRYVNYDTDNT